VKKLLLFAMVACASAQTTFTLSGPVSAWPGQTINLTMTMVGSSGLNIAGVQWSTTLASGMALGAPTVPAAVSTLGDAAYCGPVICLVAGSISSLSDGPLATVPVLISAGATPGTVALPLSGLFAASVQGLNVNGLASGTTYSLKLLSRCDLNGDGLINAADVMVAVNAVIQETPCPPFLASCSIVTVVEVASAAQGNACKL
jgi:hypothetical protein